MGNSTSTSDVSSIPSESPAETIHSCVDAGQASTSINKILADRHHLLNIFPEEMWFLIFEKLDDDDLVNLSNSSLYLRQLLLPQRVHFMFRNVVEIMTTKHEETLLVNDEICCEFLGLRLVCRSWNNVLESLCELKNGESEVLGSYIEVLMSSEMKNRVFSLAEDSSYSTTGRHPFFGRRMEIYIGWQKYSEDFLNAILSVLKTHGRSLWQCTINIWENESLPLHPPAVWHSKIRKLLEEMPNLRVLRFLEYPHDQIVLPPNQVAELETEINSSPFPSLKYLQKLETQYVPSQIFQELVQKNSHVSSLEIFRFREHADYDIYNLSLQNLSTLSIAFTTEDDFLKFVNAKVSWPLTQLDMHFYLESCSHNWQTVFNMLHDKFRKTLTHLCIIPQRALSTAQNCNCKLDLPNLTHLELELKMCSVVCLDFLLPTQNSLTHLALTMEINDCKKEQVFKMTEQVEEASVIKLLSCAKTGVKSNIWNVFPKLRKLDFSLQVGNEVLLNIDG